MLKTVLLAGRRAAAALVTLVCAAAVGSGEDAPADPARLARLLPAADALEGWRPVGEPLFFGPDNLWDYINGQAVHYLEYGFKGLVVGEYQSAEGAGTLSVEVYLMRSPDHAFGIYASERVPGDDAVEVGASGYGTTGAVTFWKGHCYVKLFSFGDGAGDRSSLERAARLVAAGIEGRSSQPALLSLLPREGRVPGSERYIPKNVLGQGYLHNAVLAGYLRDDDRFQFVVVELGSPAEAAAAFARYEAFLRKEGYQVERTTAEPTRLTAARERVAVLFLHGPLIGGVVDAADLRRATGACAELLAAVEQVGLDATAPGEAPPRPAPPDRRTP